MKPLGEAPGTSESVSESEDGKQDHLSQDELFRAVRAGDLRALARIPQSGLDLNAADENGDGLLALAATLDDEHLAIRVAKTLVAAGAGLDVPDGDGDSPLVVALQTDKFALAEYLFDAGADTHSGNAGAWYSAAAAGQSLLLEKFIWRDLDAACKQSKAGEVNWASLARRHRATCRNVEELQSVPLNGPADRPPLSVAARIEAHIHATPSERKQLNEVLARACDNLPCISVKGGGLELAMLAAAKFGHLHTMKVLAAYGASTDGSRLGIPMHKAASYGQIDAMKLLLKYGASVDQRDRKGKTALDLALMRGETEAALWLLQNGARREPKTLYRKYTALTMAVYHGDPQLLEALLAEGDDPNQSDARGATPLNLAVQQGQEALAQLLLSWGADPYRKAASGQTPEALAKEKGLHDFLLSVELADSPSSREADRHSRALAASADAPKVDRKPKDGKKKSSNS